MEFSLLDFGAKGDGQTDDTASIQRALDACSEAGGGRVRVPAGVYMTVSLELKSYTELHLEPGAVLRGIYQGAYRPISPGEDSLTALVFAKDAENVAITGGGTLDGQGHRYWKKLGAPRSGRPDVEEVGAAQFWYEHCRDLPKPNRMLAFLRCQGVQVRDVRLTGSTAWTCHLIESRNVKIRGIDIENPVYGPNTDGIDVDGSSDVLISDCTIRTGDDAVVLKTTNKFGGHCAIRNVTVTNCRFHTGCNGFKIGTETEEDIENICFSNTTIYSPPEARPTERCITGIAIETVDGGNVRNVVCSNITMMNARTALFIRLGERLRGGREHAGELRGIALSNIIAAGATHPSVISGFPGHPVEDVQIHNLQLETLGGGIRTQEEIGPIPEKPEEYPEVFMFEEVPASSLYLRHIDRLQLSNLMFRLQKEDMRPAVFAEDVDREVSLADPSWTIA
ncbi:MAG: glycosyl hydrolase family 28 protein [Kiritimatiellia bacterium]